MSDLLRLLDDYERSLAPDPPPKVSPPGRRPSKCFLVLLLSVLVGAVIATWRLGAPEAGLVERGPGSRAGTLREPLTPLSRQERAAFLASLEHGETYENGAFSRLAPVGGKNFVLGTFKKGYRSDQPQGMILFQCEEGRAPRLFRQSWENLVDARARNLGGPEAIELVLHSGGMAGFGKSLLLIQTPGGLLCVSTESLSGYPPSWKTDPRDGRDILVAWTSLPLESGQCEANRKYRHTYYTWDTGSSRFVPYEGLAPLELDQPMPEE